MRPVLDAWVRMIAAARAAGVPVIYTTPVSRADGADAEAEKTCAQGVAAAVVVAIVAMASFCRCR
jgi:nicotinamidase-related amidase